MRLTPILAIIALFLLAGCASQPVAPGEGPSPADNVMTGPDTHECAPQPGETCELAPEGEANREIFDELNADLTIGEDIAYFQDVEGFYAQPVEEGDYPGVIMIHEWWGLNDNIRDMARLLAQEGYRVLAVDLYNGAVAQTPDEARSYMTTLDQEEAIENMRAAKTYLKEQGASRIASMGWCFGGGQSLQYALSGADLDATIIYYGRLTDDTDNLAIIDQPVLGIFGSEDTSIPVASVEAFKQALQENTITHEIHIYEGVGHAFANPSGSRYAPEETRDAWEKTLDFLEEFLK